MEFSADMISTESLRDAQSAVGSMVGPPASTLERESVAVGGIIGERWPTLARSMGRYEQKVAESFSQAAYEMVTGGIIRLDDRRRLGAAAKEMGIRDFDAQLLIACAVRKWALDHSYDATPSRHEPALSFEYQAWGKLWVRLALVACTAIILDGMIIWKWLS
jgi:hypothetical protein